MPQFDPTLQRYLGASGRQYHSAKRGIPPAAAAWVARVRSAKIAPYVASEDTVLEYGAGYGWNLASLNCARRLGFDVADFLESEIASRGIEFVRDIRAVPSDSVDVVVCHHVLEHLLSPPDALAEARRLLRPDGTLLLYVPFEKERRYRKYRSGEPNHHLYSWNVQTLGNLVTDCGFTFVKGSVRMFSYDRFCSVWAWRLRLGETGYRFLRVLAHAACPCLEVHVAARKGL